MSDKAVPVRKLALRVIMNVLCDGQSLSLAREKLYASLEPGRDRAFAMHLVQGVLRWRWKLQAILDRCLDKPLRNKEHEVRTILYMALYELMQMDTPDYAAVDEAVKLVRALRKQWAKGLVNAVLRKFGRQRQQLLDSLDEVENLSHPQWLLETIRESWPDDWKDILANNNEIASTHLRVNPTRSTLEQLEAALEGSVNKCSRHELAKDALVIDSTSITSLPGFEDGSFSVQDAGAQLLPSLLQLSEGDCVLDLCAAPGGKACHLLEASAGNIDLLAVDIDSDRLQRIEQNLERLGLQASVMQADASQPDWYQGEAFDHIVLDAPCSATGVIRRHPDIKSLRQPEDIAELVALQSSILEHAWPLLKAGGTLVYVTCSVLQQENAMQVSRFLERHEEASIVPLDVPWGRPCDVGRQLLPGIEDTDGFYFACISKNG